MINPMDLSGKTILVTGASSGIGRETCRCLSELGARIVLVARNKEKLAETAATLEGNGHLVEPFDCTLVDEIPNWLVRIAKLVGPFDGIVHSAGFSVTQPIRIWNAKDTDAMMRINLYPCFALAKGLRLKAAHKQGASLVFLSSITGLCGQPGLAVYTATKAGIIGVTKCLALELIPDGIRVNCVAPAMVETEMAVQWRQTMTEEQIDKRIKEHPMGFGTPRDVANSIAFLLSDASRWITGTTLVTDGGYTA